MDGSATLAVPDIARWRAGNTGVEGVWHFDSGKPGRRVAVTALLHGNEFCGATAVSTILDAGLRPRRGSLTLVLCNLAAFDRFDPGAPHASRLVDEDMNRVWTTQQLNEPRTVERRRASELLPWLSQADWLLDLHSMHEPSAALLLAGIAPRHLALARELGAPHHVVVDAGHADGCRLRDYGQFATHGRPDALALLLESGYHFDPASSEVALDIAARFLTLSDAVDNQHIPRSWFRPRPAVQTVLSVTDAVVARSMNFEFSQAFTGLEVIERAGTVIAHDAGHAVRTPYDDCVLVMPSLRQLRPGVTVVRLARRETHLWSAPESAAEFQPPL
jgi:succinylglutamate desuccinylase